jgi:hypothetical protein
MMAVCSFPNFSETEEPYDGCLYDGKTSVCHFFVSACHCFMYLIPEPCFAEQWAVLSYI